ncbi:MAG: hypothetical protein U5K84_07050 [Alkalibacterium sp.]|nr:hypothetical protein [Alkalibacterium sp.]
MKNKKKIIIVSLAVLGSILAAVSGLFTSIAVVGKKIDKAYSKDGNQDNRK